MALIELEGFGLKQGGFQLEIPKLRLSQGELVAICGNNGSGKSTFLSALAGLRDFQGRYALAGEDFRHLSLRERARLLSFLPQEGTVSLPFEVAYVVLTGRFPHVQGRGYSPEDQRKTQEALKDFDLEHLKERPFHQLSGGEKQRVLLARTFVRESPVILLDEPFSAVDLKHQHRLLRLFRERKEQALIVAVMHDLALALEHFQRFLFFKEGKLLFDLKRQELDDAVLSEVFGCPLRLLRCHGHFLVEIEPL